MIRVVVAEDDYLVREGVVRLLETMQDIEVAASCTDFDGLLAAVDTKVPDVVLTDIRMPPTGYDGHVAFQGDEGPIGFRPEQLQAAIERELS